MAADHSQPRVRLVLKIKEDVKGDAALRVQQNDPMDLGSTAGSRDGPAILTDRLESLQQQKEIFSVKFYFQCV